MSNIDDNEKVALSHSLGITALKELLIKKKIFTHAEFIEMFDKKHDEFIEMLKKNIAEEGK